MLENVWGLRRGALDKYHVLDEVIVGNEFGRAVRPR
jgi:hypothetical protein